MLSARLVVWVHALRRLNELATSTLDFMLGVVDDECLNIRIRTIFPVNPQHAMATVFVLGCFLSL